MRYVLKAGFVYILKTICSVSSLFVMLGSWVSRLSRSVNFYRSELILSTIPVRNQKVLCKSDCRRLKPGLRNCKRCSVRYKGLMMLVVERPTVASIVPFWKPWNRGPVGRNQDVDLLNRRGYTRAVNLYNQETL